MGEVTQGCRKDINNSTFTGTKFRLPLLKAKLEDAHKEIDKRIKNKQGLYFDYINLGYGPKLIKTDISGFEINPTQFDMHNGNGIVNKIIGNLTNAIVREKNALPMKYLTRHDTETHAELKETTTHKPSALTKKVAHNEAALGNSTGWTEDTRNIFHPADIITALRLDYSYSLNKMLEQNY